MCQLVTAEHNSKKVEHWEKPKTQRADGQLRVDYTVRLLLFHHHLNVFMLDSDQESGWQKSCKEPGMLTLFFSKNIHASWYFVG